MYKKVNTRICQKMVDNCKREIYNDIIRLVQASDSGILYVTRLDDVELNVTLSDRVDGEPKMWWPLAIAMTPEIIPGITTPVVYGRDYNDHYSELYLKEIENLSDMMNVYDALADSLSDYDEDWREDLLDSTADFREEYEKENWPAAAQID
jgi:hypothetical protein